MDKTDGLVKRYWLAAALLALCGLLVACDDEPRITGDYHKPKTVTEAEKAEAMQKWSRSCALCHVNGEGGAPRLADKEAWLPRIKQGSEVLLAHTLEGYNRMPPLGYCMDCSEQDFLLMIDFMSGAAK